MANSKQYTGPADRLRDPKRLKLMETERVVSLSLEGDRFSSVLDVGTGSGLFAGLFHEYGLHVTGVDLNLEMIEAARRHVPEGRFLVSPGEATPFEAGAFDLVFMSHVLHETDDPLALAKEALRIAAKRVVFLEWPRIQEDEGPPFHHRISQEEVDAIARRYGVIQSRVLHLKRQILYIWEKN